MPVPPRKKTSITGEVQNPILRFAAELARAVQFHRLYPPDHPYVKKAAGTAFGACEVALIYRNPFTFGATDAGFFVEGEAVPDPPSVVVELAKAFRRMNMHSITVSRGVTESEIENFIIGLGELENAAIQGAMEERAVEALSRRCPDIDINTFSYEKVLAQESELLKKVKDVAAETGEDGIDLLDMLLKGEGDLDGVGGRQLSDAAASNPGDVASLLVKGIEETLSAAQADAEGLSRAGGVLSAGAEGEEVAGLEEVKERVLSLFDKIGSAMALHKRAGMTDVRNTLSAIVSFMPPSSQKLLFGEAFAEGEEAQLGALFSALPLQSRAALLFNEVLSGEGSPEKLREELTTVARRGAELASVVDRVSEKARELGIGESADRIISRLSTALQSGIRLEAFVRGTIVAADPDEDTLMDYRASLAREGFNVLTFSDGTQALKEIKREPPDLLITEVKLPGTSGIEIIGALRQSHEDVPVIVATDYPSYDGDFEIATYPKHAFFVKPVETEALVEKVNEFLPEDAELEEEPEEEGEALVDADELIDAQEVQRSLLPESLPEIEGFDIWVHYLPCTRVGGDYYDVLPFGEGSWAFVVADVSGKGVPAAMVMVLVRSIARLCLPQYESPRDGIIELNRVLSKEMKRGLFVSAILARVDAKTRTVTLCSAGQCPTLIWVPGRDRPEVRLIKHTGVVLGLGDTSYFRDGTKEQVLQLEPGGGVMAYTDGVIETMNRRREEFGTDRLMRVVRSGAHMEAREITGAVCAAMGAFTGGKARHDDTTILTIKCTK